LATLGYSLQANRKTRTGSQHPDRNAQFEHLAGLGFLCDPRSAAGVGSGRAAQVPAQVLQNMMPDRTLEFYADMEDAIDELVWKCQEAVPNPHKPFSVK
jgi:hypothetical protein